MLSTLSNAFSIVYRVNYLTEVWVSGIPALAGVLECGIRSVRRNSFLPFRIWPPMGRVTYMLLRVLLRMQFCKGERLNRENRPFFFPYYFLNSKFILRKNTRIGLFTCLNFRKTNFQKLTCTFLIRVRKALRSHRSTSCEGALCLAHSAAIPTSEILIFKLT